MTTVRDRVRTAVETDLPRRPAPLSGLLAAGAVQLAGVVLCVGLAVVVWLASDAGSAPGAMRAGAGFWLAGHGSGVTVGGIAITVVPLGVPLLAGVAVAYAAYRFAAEDLTDREIAISTAVAAATYGAALALLALMASTAEVSFSPVRAGLTGFGLAGLAGFVGAFCVDGRLRALWDAWPDFVRGVLAGCGAAVAALIGGAAALIAYRMIAGFGEAQDSLSVLAPGLVGGAAILLICVLLLPNVLLLTVSVLLGPGFAFGTDTSVTVIDVRLGELPAIPLTAVLPDTGAQPALAGVLVVLPVVAGFVGGYVAVRGIADATIYDSMVRGSTAGGAAGLLIGLAVLCAGGAAGPGRMSDIGAVMWCLPVAVAALAVGGAAGAAWGHYREARIPDE